MFHQRCLVLTFVVFADIASHALAFYGGDIMSSIVVLRKCIARASIQARIAIASCSVNCTRIRQNMAAFKDNAHLTVNLLVLFLELISSVDI